MTPWWLRPTAEGASKEETPQEPAVPETQPETAPSLEPVVEAAEIAPITPIAQVVPSTPVAVAPPLPSPSQIAPIAPIVPIAPIAPAVESAPAAPLWRPWRTTPDEIAPPVSAMLDREPESVPVFAAPAAPVEPKPQPFLSEVAAIASAPIAEAAVSIDLAPETTPEAAETEEAREGRRRSRRRGGRRRNGRGAAESAPLSAPEEDEEEEDEVEAPIAPPVRRSPMLDEVVLRRRETAFDYDGMAREIVVTMPERRSADERKIALFCDLENVALGVRDSEIKKFDIELVLERLLEKGKIIVKKAYADWERYSDYKRPFHEAAIELIDIPQKHYSGKNSADIKMVVDAMDLSYSKEHLDTFVLLSGDSDFSPLVSKLKENNKYVIGIGVKNSSSALLIDNCDEFIFYEDVWRDQQKAPHVVGVNKKSTEAFSLMVESIQALLRENKDVLWGSMIKQTMQRKKPAFNEGYYGYSTFSELLEDAERNNVIKLKKDQRSGTYIVTGFSGTKR